MNFVNLSIVGIKRVDCSTIAPDKRSTIYTLNIGTPEHLTILYWDTWTPYHTVLGHLNTLPYCIGTPEHLTILYWDTWTPYHTVLGHLNTLPYCIRTPEHLTILYWDTWTPYHTVLGHLNTLPYCIGTPEHLTILVPKFEKIYFTTCWCVLNSARWVASSVDPDQMSHSAVSDLGLHY